MVAARKRTSTVRAFTAPTRITSRVSITRSNLTCNGSGSSPISSSITVPPSAVSSRPGLASRASVNAARSWPNSSASNSDDDSVAQLMPNERLAPRAATGRG